MRSIRLRGRSLGPCMASGQSAMLVSCVVSAVSVSACLTVCLPLTLFCPLLLKLMLLVLHDYMQFLNTTEVQ